MRSKEECRQWLESRNWWPEFVRAYNQNLLHLDEFLVRTKWPDCPLSEFLERTDKELFMAAAFSWVHAEEGFSVWAKRNDNYIDFFRT